ncbi:unnamed protein product, partial [Dibothriocephalus latus]
MALKSILTRYKAWANYFQGTPNNPQDLTRVCYRTAHGAIVLATPNSSCSNDEDGANIMQAIALKSHSDNIRVLVQLNHFSNKCLPVVGVMVTTTWGGCYEAACERSTSNPVMKKKKMR